MPVMSRKDQGLAVAEDFARKVRERRINGFCIIAVAGEDYAIDVFPGEVSPLALLGGAQMLLGRLALYPEETVALSSCQEDR